jgi:hypothetical protein
MNEFEQIRAILEDFAWDRVVETVEKLDWTWRFEGGWRVPVEAELR